MNEHHPECEERMRDWRERAHAAEAKVEVLTELMKSEYEFLGWMCPAHFNVMTPPEPLGHFPPGSALLCPVDPDEWEEVFRKGKRDV